MQEVSHEISDRI